MATEKTVRIVNAALDDSPLRGGSIILRGLIAPESLCSLRADEYQREVIIGKRQNKLIEAIRNGEVIPDVELGMRGERFYQPKKAGDIVQGEFILRDPVFIIDGLQRVSAGILVRDTTELMRLGATVHFDTTQAWERDRFYILNTARLSVSPNVHIRNLREGHVSAAALFGLSHAEGFVARNRVSWGQKMKRNELISAFAFSKAAGAMHSWVVGGLRDSSVINLIGALDNLAGVIGITMLKKNTSTFFDTIDKCWGLERVQYREAAPQIKTNFMLVLAAIFCDHKDFWGGRDQHELFVNIDTRRKLAGFRLNDPAVSNLAGSAGKARHLLYDMIRGHINSGRRTTRLTPRDPGGLPSFETEDEQEAA